MVLDLVTTVNDAIDCFNAQDRVNFENLLDRNIVIKKIDDAKFNETLKGAGEVHGYLISAKYQTKNPQRTPDDVISSRIDGTLGLV